MLLLCNGFCGETFRPHICFSSHRPPPTSPSHCSHYIPFTFLYINTHLTTSSLHHTFSFLIKKWTNKISALKSPSSGWAFPAPPLGTTTTTRTTPRRTTRGSSPTSTVETAPPKKMPKKKPRIIKSLGGLRSAPTGRRTPSMNLKSTSKSAWTVLLSCVKLIWLCTRDTPTWPSPWTSSSVPMESVSHVFLSPDIAS